MGDVTKKSFVVQSGQNYASRQLEYIHAVQISNDVENVITGFAHFFPELKLFKANENEEMVIRKAIFKGLTKLEVLYLQNKGIRTFEEGVFRDLKLLRILFLDHNQLQNMEASILNDLPALQEIHLHNNPLLNVKSDQFVANKNLKIVTVCNATEVIGLDYIKCLENILSNSIKKQLETTQIELEICGNDSKKLKSRMNMNCLEASFLNETRGELGKVSEELESCESNQKNLLIQLGSKKESEDGHLRETYHEFLKSIMDFLEKERNFVFIIYAVGYLAFIWLMCFF